MGKKVLVTGPAIEPLSYSEVLAHLKINSFDEDTDLSIQTKIEGLITAVRKNVEEVYGRALILQTWKYYLDCFPGQDYIELPLPLLQGVTSVKYTDSFGTQTPMTETTDYIVDIISNPGRIVLAYAMSWPTFTPYPTNPIEIEFTCGYGSLAESVPEPIRFAMLISIADLWEHPQDLTDKQVYRILAIDNFLNPSRVWGF